MDGLLIKTFGTTWTVADGREIAGYLQRAMTSAIDSPDAFFDYKRWYFYTDATLEHNQTLTDGDRTYIVKITETDAAVTFAEGQSDESLKINRYLVET